MIGQSGTSGDYESYETNTHIFFITEDAVAENIPVGISSAVTSNAYAGIRAISKSDGSITDFEVFGRLGTEAMDIVALDESGREWEDVEISRGLGFDDNSIIDAIAKRI